MGYSEVVFWRFQGEGVEFSKSNLPQIFDTHLLKNTNESPSSFQFSLVDYAETVFGVRNRKNSVYAIWKSSKNAVVW